MENFPVGTNLIKSSKNSDISKFIYYTDYVLTFFFILSEFTSDRVNFSIVLNNSFIWKKLKNDEFPTFTSTFSK